MNTFDEFAVLFEEDTIYPSKTAYPLGQATTDILNWDGAVLNDLVGRVRIFDTALRQMLAGPGNETVHDTQRNSNSNRWCSRTGRMYRSLLRRPGSISSTLSSMPTSTVD